MTNERKTKVLILDDSAYNRRALADFVSAEPDMEVVGKAVDGEEGLMLAMSHRPDVITLDLEMPRMDGFTFLRILMAKQPTPVIVVSSYGNQENVFRALELGAVDFIAKPSRRISPDIEEIRRDLIAKIRVARTLRRETVAALPAPPDPAFDAPGDLGAQSGPATGGAAGPGKRIAELPASRVVAIAASTGGPTALTRVLRALPGDLDAGIVVVQHMPPRFTKSFAERLDRLCRLCVVEVTGQEPFRRGAAYIACGELCIEIDRSDDRLTVRAVKPDGSERYVPSADRLFASVAGAVGRNVLAIVLTGMGDDGSRGLKPIAEAGGMVIAEDESTAVIPGMPRAAVATGLVTQVLPLDQIASAIRSFAR